ncbi:hypothetical protein PILCRDRAFT_216764 [Piloderma croceum F 1598]|uniref:Uncharacterized protein n=1 Tax=Piloderma croceum (strain F 1598) TaxID=765440 RepID=A0A0C3CHG9_PILCF|nr:hypothetical protein PILCRDRAFT_216764 [Piloderma croceum F 1598]
MNTFLVLQIIPSHAGLPLLVITFLFSQGAKRHPTLINVCISWIMSGIFSTMLLYAGQSTGPEPDKALCMAQTSLLYGVTPMCAVAILMLVYYVWTCYDSHRYKPTVLATHNPEKVNRSRRFFYCSLDYHPLSNSMSIFTAFICLSATAIEIRIALMLHRNWRGLRKAGKSSGVSVQFIVRILVFGTYIFMSMLFSLATVWDPRSAVPDMYVATIRFAVMLIFGSQPDVWRTWWPWRRRRPQRVINLSQEPSYMNRKFDLDEKISDSDGDILDIGNCIVAYCSGFCLSIAYFLIGICAEFSLPLLCFRKARSLLTFFRRM